MPGLIRARSNTCPGLIRSNTCGRPNTCPVLHVRRSLDPFDSAECHRTHRSATWLLSWLLSRPRISPECHMAPFTLLTPECHMAPFTLLSPECHMAPFTATACLTDWSLFDRLVRRRGPCDSWEWQGTCGHMWLILAHSLNSHTLAGRLLWLMWLMGVARLTFT